MHYVGHVAPAPLSTMTKLWYCDITRRSDIVTEHKCSHAVFAIPRPHAIRKDKAVRTPVLLHCKQKDISQ